MTGTRSSCCSLPWSQCHCGDWRVVTTFGVDRVNPSWEHHQAAPASMTTRRAPLNGRVTTRRRAASDRLGTRIA